MQFSAEGELGTVMAQAFCMDACSSTNLFQQVDGRLLKDAGADSAQNVVRATLLHDDGVDARLVQQRAQQ